MKLDCKDRSVQDFPVIPRYVVWALGREVINRCQNKTPGLLAAATGWTCALWMVKESEQTDTL